MPSKRPRIVLIDEIDKSDIDLPNDLLHIFEEGSFTIPELSRMRQETEIVKVLPADGGEPVAISGGVVSCERFPFVVMTSNGEREFPPPFLRRCLRLNLPQPSAERLAQIVTAHLPLEAPAVVEEKERGQLITDFVRRAREGDLAADQLLNAVYLTIGPKAPLGEAASANDPATAEARQRIREAVLQYLSRGADGSGSFL